MADDPVLIALRDFMERELEMTRTRYQSRADRFRAAAVETHAEWRLHCLPLRWNAAAVMIFREAIGDIVRLRLRIAYMPLFEGLERIERRVGVLADLRKEPWVSATHPANRKAP